MKVIFKIKREGSVFVIKANIKGRKVVVTQAPYERFNSIRASKAINALEHDKDVIVKGDTSKRAKGRDKYVTGIGVLKRWKDLAHFASLPFKRYKGYRSIPTTPMQALQRTRVLWDYLSKYGGDKLVAHRILGMPTEKQHCTLCQYVHSTYSKLSVANCTLHCPVDWDGYGHKKVGELPLLCYEPNSPYHQFQHLFYDENRHAAKGVLDLVDLAIRNAEQIN